MINWTNVRLEEQLRSLLGDFLLDDILELMSFDRLVKWIDEPNEYFDGRSPSEVIKVDGVEHIEELVGSQKFNNYN